MPSLIKDLAGYFLGTVPEASKARPPPETPTQRGDKDGAKAWWWETRETDRDAFASSRHRAHLPRCKRTGRPLKILALHGRGSNNDITSIQLSSLEVPTRCVADLLSRRRSSPQSDVFHMLSGRPFHEWGHDEEALKASSHVSRAGPTTGMRLQPRRRRRRPSQSPRRRASARSGPGASSSACGVPPPGDGTVDRCCRSRRPGSVSGISTLIDVRVAPSGHAKRHELP